MDQQLSEQYLKALQQNGYNPPIEKIEADLLRFGIEELSQDYLEILASRCQEFRTAYATEYEPREYVPVKTSEHMLGFEAALRTQVKEEVNEALRLIQEKPEFFRVELVKSLSQADKYHPDQMVQLQDRITGSFRVTEYLQADINNVGWVVFGVFIFSSILGLAVALNVQQNSFQKQQKEHSAELQQLREYRDSAERDAIERANRSGTGAGAESP